MKKPRTRLGSGKSHSESSTLPSSAETFDADDTDQNIEIGGEIITVRKIGFIEGMRLGQILKPVVEDLCDLAESETGAGLQEITDTLQKYPDETIQMLSLACDRSIEWGESLSDFDGQTLLMAVWSLNSRSLLMRVATRRAVKNLLPSRK